MPYGMKENIATIEALESIAWKQKLIPGRMSLNEWMVDPSAI